MTQRNMQQIVVQLSPDELPVRNTSMRPFNLVCTAALPCKTLKACSSLPQVQLHTLTTAVHTS